MEKALNEILAGLYAACESGTLESFINSFTDVSLCDAEMTTGGFMIDFRDGDFAVTIDTADETVTVGDVSGDIDSDVIPQIERFVETELWKAPRYRGAINEMYKESRKSNLP